MKHLIESAKAVALAGPGVGPSRNFKVGAILFDKRHRILNAKHNSYKTHPFLTRWTKYPFLHAESSCILGYGLDNTDGLSLLVVRIRRDLRLSMARPCVTCSQLASLANIKNIYYSDWNGDIKCVQ